jgi:ribosome-binding protein aMBF1 (putative translation factor)
MICELCGREGQTNEHHVFFGTANRKQSTKYHMVARLCPDCHQNGPRAVHRCRETDLILKRRYQAKFEEEHTREEFRKIFGKSWL